MYSPKSVSSGVYPPRSNAARSPTSSEVMDFAFRIRVQPFRRASPPEVTSSQPSERLAVRPLNVLVAEDVITKGGRVQQTADLVTRCGGVVVGIAVLVDRSAGAVDFGVPVRSLLQLQLATYEPDDCDLCRRGLPIQKPGS